jgi:hypothetical protein
MKRCKANSKMPEREELERQLEALQRCTTENGSSGGPVYSTEARLFGLHHLGVSPMRLEPGNFAVDMGSILDEIRSKGDSHDNDRYKAPTTNWSARARSLKEDEPRTGGPYQ